MNEATEQRAKELAAEIMADINKAIDANHENGFALVNMHRKLQMLNSLLNGVLDREIEEFRELIERGGK